MPNSNKHFINEIESCFIVTANNSTTYVQRKMKSKCIKYQSLFNLLRERKKKIPSFKTRASKCMNVSYVYYISVSIY